MPKLPADIICSLLRPYVEQDVPRPLCEKIQRYASLLEIWNKKLNLTAVREPEQIIERHFGESFFMARLLPEFQSLLDVGSGAGFPGLPISMLRPAAEVTLAESQVRKAIFLREAAWMVGSRATVWAHRVEELEADLLYNVVVLRAVDNMADALAAAAKRVAEGGTLAFFHREAGAVRLPDGKWVNVTTYDVPQSSGRIVRATRQVVVAQEDSADAIPDPNQPSVNLDAPPAGVRYARIRH